MLVPTVGCEVQRRAAFIPRASYVNVGARGEKPFQHWQVPRVGCGMKRSAATIRAGCIDGRPPG
jgi:hypothetical protein